MILLGKKVEREEINDLIYKVLGRLGFIEVKRGKNLKQFREINGVKYWEGLVQNRYKMGY